MINLDQATTHIRNEFLEEGMIESIKNGEYQTYPPPTGLPELQELVLHHFKLDGYPQPTAIITNGAISPLYDLITKISKYYGIRHFIDSEPGWKWPRFYGQQAPSLKLKKSKITPDDIEERDMVYICNPQNPIGFEYDESELKALINKCEATDSWFLYDCAYEAFIETLIPACIMYDKVITFFSFSKSPGTAGMRCGGVILNQKWAGELMAIQPSQVGTNLPVQRGLINAYHHKAEWYPELIAIHEMNRNYIYTNLSERYMFSQPDMSNSVWVDLPDDIQSDQLCAAAKAAGILLRDGKYYNYDSFTDNGNFIKIGTTVPPDRIDKAIKFLSSYKY